MDPSTSYRQNRLLAGLPAADAHLLCSGSRHVTLRAHTVLYEPGDPPDEVYFPHGGAISLGIMLANADVIQTAVLGCDGVVGGMAALEPCPEVARTQVRMETTASVVSAARLRDFMAQSAAVRSMVLRYHQFVLAQAQWTAACNASHALEQRLSRSLLRFAQVSGVMTLTLTQELLAELLGVKRTSVSLVAHRMQQDGLIRIRRGHVDILKPDLLEQAACECHRSINQYYRVLFDSDGGTAARGQQAAG